MLITLPSETSMRKAFAAKVTAFDGLFIVAVKTTGIYCRPVCRARQPLAKNIHFFASADEARKAGYRACKLCRPDGPPSQRPALVRRLIDLADTQETRVREVDLAEFGIDRTMARRQFKTHVGMTYAAYQRTRRLGAAARLTQNGLSTIHAQQAAGFKSASGFRAALARLVGSFSGDVKDARSLG